MLWLGWGFRAHQPWRASVPASRPDPKRRHAAALQNALTPRHNLLPCSGRATAFPPGQEKLISGLFFVGHGHLFAGRCGRKTTVGYFADYRIVWQNPRFDPFVARRRAPLPEEPIRGVRRPSGARGGDTFCCQGSRIGAENTEQGLTP